MNKFDLDRAARSIDLPSGDVDTVTARGVTLARRRHRVLAGGLTVSLVAGSVGLYARLNQATPVPVAAGGATAKRGDVPIRWERVETTSGLGYTTTLSEDALYAVATGPGRAAVEDTRRVVWHSDNGVDWSAVTQLKDDLYIANLADHGAHLYGVGTGAATARVAGRKPVADLVVGSSDDGGRNWARQTLPIDMAAISAKSRSVGVYAVDIATTKDAVVAIASLNADLDVPALLPAGTTAPNGWAFTDAGVDVLGNGPRCPAGTTSAPPGQPDKRAMVEAQQGPTGPQREYTSQCFAADGTSSEVTPQQSRGVVASYTWDQLHVDGDLLRAVKTTPMVFRAPANTLAFERIDAPNLATLDGPGMLDRDGDGLFLLGQTGPSPDGSKGRSQTVVLRSVDGAQWTAAPTPDGLAYAMSVGRLGDRAAILGDTGNGPAVWLTDGQGGWTMTSLTTAVDPALLDKSNISLVSAGIGQLGAVAVVSVMPDAIAKRGGVNVERDGYTLHILNDRWAATITDASGREVAHSDGVMSDSDGAIRGGMRSGDGSINYVNTETGATIVRFPLDAFKSATDAAMRAESNPTYRIVASRDGDTWSDVDVNTLAGEPIGNVIRVLMTGERAVIAVGPPISKNTGTQSLKQIALVGTPR